MTLMNTLTQEIEEKESEDLEDIVKMDMFHSFFICC